MRKKVFISISILVLVWLGFLFWFLLSQNHLEKSLRGISVDVFLDNNKYEIRNGRVTVGGQDRERALRLAAFYTINYEDPLFTFPEFNVDEFEKSINDLKSSESDLLSVLGIEGKNLFPHSFLTSMINASRKNQEFLEHPSYENAVEIINSQYEASQSYEEEAKKVMTVLKQNPGPAGILLGVRADNKTAVSDFIKLINNSKALSEEIKRREDCLNGRGECIRTVLNIEKPEGFGRKLSSGVDVLGKDLIYYPLEEDDSVNGPYVSTSPCYGWGDNYSYPSHLFYLKKGQDNTGETYSDIQLATDIYFRQVPQVSSFTTDKVLNQQGVEYIKIDSTTLYLCYYNGYLAEILTLDSFLNEKSPFIDENKFKKSERDFISEVKKLETNFFTNEFPSYENAKLLSEYYLYLYKLLLEDEGADESFKKELLERYLYLDRKLVNINEIVRYGKSLIDGLVVVERTSEKIDPGASERLMFPGRTFYGLLYFPFSKSVYRLEEDLGYFQNIHLKGIIGLGKVFLNYREAIKKYDISTIQNWIVARDEVSQDLIKELEE